MSRVKVFCDGGSRGNPGPAASGVVITDDREQVMHEFCEYLGETTNNVAEYNAVILALKHLEVLEITEADFFLDSELVVRQLSGQYKVKQPHLAQMHTEILHRVGAKSIRFTHVRREYNKLADAQVNKCLDQHTKLS